jgi:hypothetical protein
MIVYRSILEGVFTTVAVNFSPVVHRLTRNIEHFTGQSIPVFFPCRGDDARFSRTFKPKGDCVVVRQPGYLDRYAQYKSQTPSFSDRSSWVEGDNATSFKPIKTTHISPLQKTFPTDYRIVNRCSCF